MPVSVVCEGGLREEGDQCESAREAAAARWRAQTRSRFSGAFRVIRPDLELVAETTQGMGPGTRQAASCARRPCRRDIECQRCAQECRLSIVTGKVRERSPCGRAKYILCMVSSQNSLVKDGRRMLTTYTYRVAQGSWYCHKLL